MTFLQFRPMNANDTADFLTITTYANTLSNGILMPFMLFVIFMISLVGMVFSGRPFHRALTYSGFLCSLLGILLAIMSMINVNYVYFLFLLTGIGLIWTKLAEGLS